MKSNFTKTALIWICNITLAILFIAIAVAGYYMFKNPVQPQENLKLEGMTSYKYSQKLNLAGSLYFYQNRLDSPSSQLNEYYFYVPERTSYLFEPDKAPVVSARKLNPELSDTTWFGLKTVSVYTDQAEVPLLNVTPGVEISREEFIRFVRMDFFGLMVMAGYILIVVWVLRKFVSGLSSGDFFTKKNALNLRITGWMIVAAPILHFIWVGYMAPSLNIVFSIEGASFEELPIAPFEIEIFIAGLILLVIAKAFDEGIQLKKEQELTI